jgi:hypothetical protein
MRILPLVALLLSLVGCDRPTEKNCQAAIDNMHKIMEIKQPDPGETAAAVRRCRAHSKNKTVDCFKAATDQKSLEACGTMAAAE